uniref:DDE-1 domain-containing protein n=1 Tax=Hyaloperonospora arabidopsidis (strain Emoy2) TaxID=559515 RepID=M4BZX3_HYAAE
MDAEIISAFKRHHRRFYLQNGLNREEQNYYNLYNVDQLTATRWSLSAWSEISSGTVKNCFRHTGIMTDLAGRQEAGAGKAVQDGAVSMKEQLVDQELETVLERLSLRNPVSPAYFLNPVEEEESAHMELTDAKIMKLVQE